jgi:hypothetical protein
MPTKSKLNLNDVESESEGKSILAQRQSDVKKNCFRTIYICISKNLLSQLRVIIDGVWIGEQIY